MGVSTIVKVVKQHEIDELMFQVVKSLKNGFGNKFIPDSATWRDVNRNNQRQDGSLFFEMSFTLDYESSSFSDNKEHRSISIFHYPEMNQDFYSINFNAWGHNKEIANCLVDYFGGYANYDDCDDIEIDYCKSQIQSYLGIRS